MKGLRNLQKRKQLFESESYACTSSLNGDNFIWTISLPANNEVSTELGNVFSSPNKFFEQQTQALSQEVERSHKRFLSFEEEKGRKTKFIRELAKTIIKQKSIKLKALAKQVSFLSFAGSKKMNFG